MTECDVPTITADLFIIMAWLKNKELPMGKKWTQK